MSDDRQNGHSRPCLNCRTKAVSDMGFITLSDHALADRCLIEEMRQMLPEKEGERAECTADETLQCLLRCRPSRLALETTAATFHFEIKCPLLVAWEMFPAPVNLRRSLCRECYVPSALLLSLIKPLCTESAEI